MPTLTPDQIEAAAAVVSAGGAIGIPLVLAWLGSAAQRREARRAEAAEMREFSDQWQQYNLAVASSDQAADAVRDAAFHVGQGGTRRALDRAEKQALHAIFFKLTAMYQAFYAVQRGVVEQSWPHTIIRDLAPTVFDDPALLEIALNGRGYSEDFVTYVRAAAEGNALPPVKRVRGRRWWSYFGPWAIILIAVADIAISGAGVYEALRTGPVASPTGRQLGTASGRDSASRAPTTGPAADVATTVAAPAAATSAEATLRAAQIAAVFAVVAAIITLSGAVANAVVSRRNGITQARTSQQVKHAEFRQDWINVLREQMARFQALAFSRPEVARTDPEVAEAMLRVVMQMNPKDPRYGRLTDLMYSVMGSEPAGTFAVGNDGPSPPLAANPLLDPQADFVTVCQAILKTEWDVTKEELHRLDERAPAQVRGVRTVLRLGPFRIGWEVVGRRGGTA